MSVTPAVLTETVLTQREAAPVTMIQSEEVLRTRTPAYSQTNSDISFMVRQPSASAILTNYVELLVEVRFRSDNNFSAIKELKDTYLTESQAARDFGYIAEGLPWQSKAIRNAVITINGTSISQRCNEFGKEYAKMHCNRAYMEKIGGGWNDNTELMNKGRTVGAYNGTGKRDNYVMSKTSTKQYKKWKMMLTQDDTAEATAQQTAVFQFREPLFMGPFGAFGMCESFPAWSSEGMKSPGLLHVHNMQLQLSLEDNWQNGLFLPVYQYAKASGFAQVGIPEITKAELVCKWVLPPPRLVSAALTQSVSYASFDVLRFVGQPLGQAAKIDNGETCQFRLNAVSFPYMPSLFMFSICPHYAHCAKWIAGQDVQSEALNAMKKDKRMTITHMDLSINTSSASLPHKGGEGVQTRRLNARDLYQMTLENAASFENFPDDFESWYFGGGFCCITPAQLSGNLASPNIRGTVVVQGTINAINKMGCPVNVSSGSVNFDAGDATVYPDAPLPRYQCIISGIYSNRALVLDSKSGIMQESTYSQAFSQQLRLGAGGQ